MNTKIYNVVVNGMEDGISVYSEVRSFKTFKGAEECLHKEFEYIKSEFCDFEWDINDYCLEEDKENAWFDVENYQYNFFCSGSIFVCDLED